MWGCFVSESKYEKRLNRFRSESKKPRYAEIEFVYTGDALFADILDTAERRVPDEIETASCSPADGSARRPGRGLKSGPLSGPRGRQSIDFIEVSLVH